MKDKKYCLHGHLMTEANTYRSGKNGRRCRKCRNDAKKRFRAQEKEAAEKVIGKTLESVAAEHNVCAKKVAREIVRGSTLEEAIERAKYMYASRSKPWGKYRSRKEAAKEEGVPENTFLAWVCKGYTEEEVLRKCADYRAGKRTRKKIRQIDRYINVIGEDRSNHWHSLQTFTMLKSKVAS